MRGGVDVAVVVASASDVAAAGSDVVVVDVASDLDATIFACYSCH